MKSASNKSIYVKIVLYQFKSGLETVTKLIDYRVNGYRLNDNFQKISVTGNRILYLSSLYYYIVRWILIFKISKDFILVVFNRHLTTTNKKMFDINLNSILLIKLLCID
ncbi:hypothetical protein QTP88_008521 [Uroleucon formosanum]